MKRLPIATLAAAICLAGASLATLVAAAGADSPRAVLHDFVCRRALDPGNREIVVQAQMRPLTGTRRMELRFDLFDKPKGASSYTEITGGDLGKWISPSPPTLGQNPGDVWNLDKPVSDLTVAPAVYRFHVHFRWIGEHRRVLGVQVLRSPTCYQPELRPDLVVKSITVKPISGKPDADAYLAVIANTGRTAAGAFEVQFTDGSYSKTHTVQRLGPRKQVRVKFAGPACTAGSAIVTVDPDDQVDVSSRADASMTAVCPSAGQSGSEEPSSSAGG